MRRIGLSSVVVVILAFASAHPGLARAQPVEAASEAAAPSAAGEPERAARPRLSDSGELERVVSLYAGGKYDDCAREVAWLLNSDNPQRLANPHVVEDARLYHATCLVMSGREKEAIAPLRAALTQNPTMGTPDSLTFPPPLISLFLQVRKEFADAIRAEEEKQLTELNRLAEEAKAREAAEQRRIQRLQQLASTETIIIRNRRSFASIPFGVGQFQNGASTLGSLFLVSETLLLGTSIVALGIGNYQYTFIGPLVLGDDIQNNVKRARKVSAISFYSFAAVAAAGIAEAHINFVPEFRMQRRRELPKDLRLLGSDAAPKSSWSPWLSPSRAGLSAGVVGTF